LPDGAPPHGEERSSVAGGTDVTGRASVSPGRPVRLLACDLDGTLLDPSGRPVDGVGPALQLLQKNDVRVAVCTGRPLHVAQRLTGRISFTPVAYICYQGGLVVDGVSGLWLKHLRLNPAIVRSVLAAGRAAGMEVTLYEGDDRRTYTAEPTDPAAVTRVILAGEAESVASLGAALRARWGRRVRIDAVGTGVIDVLNGAVDKGNALLFLARKLGVPRASIVACGDGLSDVTMLQAAALPVAVGDVPKDVRVVADHVVPQARLAAFFRGLVA
jgi:HAD superfamily hydrolase (TIGR01484 family)